MEIEREESTPMDVSNDNNSETVQVSVVPDLTSELDFEMADGSDGARKDVNNDIENENNDTNSSRSDSPPTTETDQSSKPTAEEDQASENPIEKDDHSSCSANSDTLTGDPLEVPSPPFSEKEERSESRESTSNQDNINNEEKTSLETLDKDSEVGDAASSEKTDKYTEVGDAASSEKTDKDTEVGDAASSKKTDKDTEAEDAATSEKTDKNTEVVDAESKNIATETAIDKNTEEDENTAKDSETNSIDGAANEKKNDGDVDDGDKVENNQMDDEEDDYFDPSLLCPEVSMDVEESAVITDADEAIDESNLYTSKYSTFVDEMTGAEISFNLTEEEQELRRKLYGPNNPIEFSKVHCTACNIHLGSALAGQTNRFVHPMLKVLICKQCYHFYTSGEFEKDEDGSELYCRWCGQGGQVLCCSKCEFVFCKKCIRINFGRKKLVEVRDSEVWRCFRCDPSQLKALRAMCVEFFDYVRRETARALTLNDADFMKKDLTTCCQQLSSKRNSPDRDLKDEAKPEKRSKRKKVDVDPDYNPFERLPEKVVEKPVEKILEKALEKPKEEIKIAPNLFPTEPMVKTTILQSGIKLIQKILPPTPITTVTNPGARFGRPHLNANNVRSPNPTITTVRSATALGSARPRVITPRIGSTGTRITGPGYITVVPNQTNRVRPVGQQITTIAAGPRQPSYNLLKHEWFEKTVRAAARVNSNLSYTLTQLNKAQATAGSVEQLAVVHNKLQEILSSSINSLIQIRKNLRTEFIAGIKTIRFPPRIHDNSNKDDDDVIFVNPNSDIPIIDADSPPQTPTTPAAISDSTPTPKAASTPSGDGTRKYLKVKSFSQLQNVSSECITIPDDDPVKKPADVLDEPIVAIPKPTNGEERDPLANDSDEDPSKKIKQEKEKSPEVVRIKQEAEDSSPYNVKDSPTPKIRRMLSVKVNMKKNEFVENLVKKEPVETNGGDNQ